MMMIDIPFGGKFVERPVYYLLNVLIMQCVLFRPLLVAGMKKPGRSVFINSDINKNLTS